MYKVLLVTNPHNYKAGLYFNFPQITSQLLDTAPSFLFEVLLQIVGGFYLSLICGSNYRIRSKCYWRTGRNK